LMLRAGSAVVGVWNEAFDPDGVPPSHGTTVSGVQRDLKTAHRMESREGSGAKP
jgi:type IV secretion system protein VirB9